MSEDEVPFKSIKITLSDEALDLLDKIKKLGSFRTTSMTVEEIIRAFHDVVTKIWLAEKWAADKGKTPIPADERLKVAEYIAVRLTRFREIPKPKKK